MNELMKDLGVSNYEELLVYMEDNPDEQIVIELKEILELIDFLDEINIEGDESK